MNKLVQAGTDLLNGFIHAANKIPGLNIGDVAAKQIAPVSNPYAGAMAQDAAKAVADGYRKAYSDAKKADADFWKQARGNALKSAEDRMSEEAAAIKANRTPKTPKVDRHAEQLARDAAAMEAQIANLYKLADAYDVSGAAALIAEARVKAESKAIKQRADIEAAVARGIRLAIAERVSEAAKGTAAMNDQARLQEQVNGEVAAGNVPAERAAELLKDRLADLPLLAALEAARTLQGEQGAVAVQHAADALDKQRAAQVKANEAAIEAQRLAAMANGSAQLAQLAEELRLVGATDEARIHALATLKATQEADAKGYTGKKGADYVNGQVAIADQQQVLAQAPGGLYEALTATADKWDIIAGKGRIGRTEHG